MNQGNQEGAVKLDADGGHYRYVSLVQGPTSLPRVMVGAFTPLNSPGDTKALFMTSMDLATARAYAEAILATCEMANEDLEQSQHSTKQ